MQKKLAFALMAVMGLTLVGMACGGGEDEPAPTARPTTAASQPTAGSAPPPSGGGDVVTVVNQDPGGSGEYQFIPSEFTFGVGDTVTFQMSGETEFHTFTVDDLGIDEAVDGGETVTFTVTFDKAGTFELICIPHEAFGMKGTITVQ
jgi:plastocyanin